MRLLGEEARQKEKLTDRDGPVYAGDPLPGAHRGDSGVAPSANGRRGVFDCLPVTC